MPISATHIPYSKIPFFSPLVKDYLAQLEATRPFYHFGFDEAGMKAAIAEREKFPVDRKTLVEVLKEQYQNLDTSAAVSLNIQKLADEKTFTICTAHQPNLLTGYLYFIYKVLHTVALAEKLNTQYPGKHFVPLYYMGSEDNDLEELGSFRYGNEKFVWDADGQRGAVGRMQTQSLEPLLAKLFKVLGPPGIHTDALIELIRKAYLEKETIAAATQYLVNELFGKYGLVVLDPDSAKLKRAFIPVMKDELLDHNAEGIVNKQIEKLSAAYKIQAHPRSINLFYLKDQLRERIEKQGKEWKVLNTDTRFSEKELLEELENYPERFSPNVILRGLFQESILPDVAFIGGGAEVAYWLQLKTLFEHYNVFFPSVHLRQSVLWVRKQGSLLREKAGVALTDIFKEEQELIHEFVTKNSSASLSAGEEMQQLEELLFSLQAKAKAIDPTLEAAAGAALAKIRKQVEALEQKMYRAEKRKHGDAKERIAWLKQQLFPNQSLQERVENFIEYYPEYGASFFDTLKDNLRPFQHQFLVLEER